MEDVCSTGVANRLRVAGAFPAKFGGYCKYCCLLGQLTRAYTFARSGESTRERQRWRSDQSRSDDHRDACAPSKTLLSIHIHSCTCKHSNRCSDWQD